MLIQKKLRNMHAVTECKPPFKYYMYVERSLDIWWVPPISPVE